MSWWYLLVNWCFSFILVVFVNLHQRSTNWATETGRRLPVLFLWKKQCYWGRFYSVPCYKISENFSIYIKFIDSNDKSIVKQNKTLMSYCRVFDEQKSGDKASSAVVVVVYTGLHWFTTSLLPTIYYYNYYS